LAEIEPHVSSKAHKEPNVIICCRAWAGGQPSQAPLFPEMVHHRRVGDMRFLAALMYLLNRLGF